MTMLIALPLCALALTAFDAAIGIKWNSRFCHNLAYMTWGVALAYAILK
jgi:hypothetical protein